MWLQVKYKGGKEYLWWVLTNLLIIHSWPQKFAINASCCCLIIKVL